MARSAYRLPFLLLIGCTLYQTIARADSEEVSTQSNANGADGSSAANLSDDDVNDPAEIDEANHYLRRYGYFDDDDDERNMGITRSAANLQKAIAYMQYKAHIPITGKLNRNTIAMMRMPRCGNKDFNGQSDRLRRRRRRYSLSGNRWSKKTISYKIRNLTPDLPRSVAHKEIQRAFGIWSNVANINFREETGRASADIDIRFAFGDHGDGYDFDGRGGVLAHAFFPGRDRISGDAHFDEEERFTANSRDGTNLFMVAAHELGHSLGLGHSDVENSMMAPIYQGYRHGFRLHRDDVKGIQRLYGARQQGGTNPKPPAKPPAKPADKPAPTPPHQPAKPNTPTCNIRVNALMTTSSNALVAFSKTRFWRLTSFNGQAYSVAQGFPKTIASHYRSQRNTPLANIDAAYERVDGTHRFFKGSEFFDFSPDGQLQQTGQLSQLFRRRQRRGMPTRIDAAVMVPRANNLVYLFRGNSYWRLNDEENLVDMGYPQPLMRWSKELRPGFDAAFFTADSVFFITGNTYRQYEWNSDTLVAVNNGQPPRVDRHFFGCGSLQSGQNQANGRASALTGPNWPLVPAAMAASLAACHFVQ